MSHALMPHQDKTMNEIELENLLTLLRKFVKYVKKRKGGLKSWKVRKRKTKARLKLLNKKPPTEK